MRSNIATEKQPREFWIEECEQASPPIRVYMDSGAHHCGACKPQIHVREVAPSVSVETKTKDSGKPEAHSEPVEATGQIDLAALSDEQLNIKFAKLMRWKLVDGKWWHNDLGDGPPTDFCKTLGRQLVEECAKQLLSRKVGGSHAVGASPKASAPLTEPASGKLKMPTLEELLNTAQETAEWLTKEYAIGTPQYESGIRLQLAIERAAK